MTIIKSITSSDEVRAQIHKEPASSVLCRLTAVKRMVVGALFGILMGMSASASLAADGPALADSHPDEYTVVEGDTLWGISKMFLRDPWRWPEIWEGNPQVENPDLIYPGDKLVLTWVNGRPVLRSLRNNVVKLSPSPRATSYDAIPVIDPAAIAAYINSPLVTDENELRDAAYIVDGFNNRLLMGKYDQFYVRGISEDDVAKEYRVFRPGRHFVDPVSGESLGWEAVHLGDANMLKAGDPSRLVLTRGYEDVTIRDRLRPIHTKSALPFFFPKAPENVNVRGMILESANRETELGALSVVAVNLGNREGIQVGDVFRIRSQSVVKEDPLTEENYQIPEENIGVGMVFRTFEKVSYVLVTDSTRQLRAGDIVVSPNAE